MSNMQALVEIHESLVCELHVVISDDGVRNAEATHMFSKQIFVSIVL